MWSQNDDSLIFSLRTCTTCIEAKLGRSLMLTSGSSNSISGRWKEVWECSIPKPWARIWCAWNSSLSICQKVPENSRSEDETNTQKSACDFHQSDFGSYYKSSPLFWTFGSKVGWFTLFSRCWHFPCYWKNQLNPSITTIFFDLKNDLFSSWVKIEVNSYSLFRYLFLGFNRRVLE